MELDSLHKLEKEIDRLLHLLGKLKKENKLIKEKYQKLLKNQREDKESINSLKKENMSLPSVSSNLSSQKEAKIKEGLKEIITNLDKLLLTF